MKVVKIDENAHQILLQAKEQLRGEGVERPTHSDAIRWLRRKVER